MELSAIEVRVLGCLVEKAATTPEHYPLTTNALAAACNQKTSRDPVTAYTEREVDDAVMLLRQAGLARTVRGGRSSKHKHVMDEATGLDNEHLAVLAVLMLRGPQTPGELKSRTDRAAGFADLEDVDDVLEALAGFDDPYVKDLGRSVGQSQNRWMHLIGDGSEAIPAPAAPSAKGRSVQIAELVQRVSDLEARLAVLEGALGVDEAGE